MDPRKNFCHIVKTEPEKFDSQPVTKKAKKESADPDYFLAIRVKDETQEQIFQDPNDLTKEEVTKSKVKEESPNLDSSRKHAKECVKQEYTVQEPNGLKKEEDIKWHVKEEHVKQEYTVRQELNGSRKGGCKHYDKLERIQNSISSYLLKEMISGFMLSVSREVIGGKLFVYYFKRKMKNATPLFGFMFISDVETLIRQVPAKLHLPGLIHSRWECLTEEETFRQEIWRVPLLLGKKPKPIEADLDMFWRNLRNDVKILIHNLTKKMTAFYNKIRRAVERQLNQEPHDDLLYEFAIYFCESQEDVKDCFPDMTRQEVYDTCLLRYFALPKRKKETYGNERERENLVIGIHHGSMFGRKEERISLSENPEANHLSKEEIEAYLKKMPLTIEVEPLKGVMVKPGERERRQFIVRDIKPYSRDTLKKRINCWWKDLTAEKNFQYEVTRATDGAILMEDITLSWRNLRHDMRVKNLEQTSSKVRYYTEIKDKLWGDLNEDVLSSFSSYFCEFENVVKTEFPGMTEVEVYDTCLLRYIAEPEEIRKLYKALSTREVCKRFCNSRFGRVP